MRFRFGAFYTEGLIHGRAYFRNFTVCSLSLIGACGASLGLEDGRIPKKSFKATSMWDARRGPWRARLNHLNRGGAGGWSARYNNVFQWWQVDLGQVSRVVAVATQGRYDANQWVKKYEISYSVYGTKFTYYSIKRKVQVNADYFYHHHCHYHYHYHYY